MNTSSSFHLCNSSAWSRLWSPWPTWLLRNCFSFRFHSSSLWTKARLRYCFSFRFHSSNLWTRGRLHNYFSFRFHSSILYSIIKSAATTSFRKGFGRNYVKATEHRGVSRMIIDYKGIGRKEISHTVTERLVTEYMGGIGRTLTEFIAIGFLVVYRTSLSCHFCSSIL